MEEISITFDRFKLERFVYLIIILVLIFLLWKKPFGGEGDATCVDEIKNQGEDGVDCGGPCGGVWDEDAETCKTGETGTLPEG